MAKDLYSLAYELKDALKDNPKIKALEEIEKKMNDDEEVIALAYQKDLACSLYSDALNHYPENSPEVKKAQKDLYEKKLALDSHPLVKEYLMAYKSVRELYGELNETLFSDLSLHLKENQ